MASPSRRAPLLLAVGLLAVAGGALWFLKQGKQNSQNPASNAELVSAFYIGLGALESGEGRELEKFQRVTELAPNEPAGWANLGLLQLRKNDLEAAMQSLEKARSLAPENAAIESLLGLTESRRGNSSAAVEHLRNAAKLDPDNLQTLYALAQEIERLNTPESAREAAGVLDEILQGAPDNLVAHLERARLAAKNNDGPALKQQIAWLQTQQTHWPGMAREQLAELKKAASSPQNASITVVFLGNVLKPNERYRKDLSLLAPPANQLGQPIEHFLTLPSPSAQPAPADEAMTFTVSSIDKPAAWKKALVYQADGEGQPDALLLRDKEWTLSSLDKTFPFPGTLGAALPLDYDYDFRNDIALAGSGGFRLWHAAEEGFSDVTAKTKLPPAIINGKFTGLWAADIEMDGDLDIILGAANDTPVLRNNGDGTFKVIHPFGQLGGVQDFVWADLDGDGDSDGACFTSSAGIQLEVNERSGNFSTVKTDDGKPAEAETLDVADVNADGVLDVVSLHHKSGVISILKNTKTNVWENSPLFRLPVQPTGVPAQLTGVSTFQIADLDNNGALDFVISAGNSFMIWLGNADGKWQVLRQSQYQTLKSHLFGVVDATQNGRLDLLALDPKGAPQWLVNIGSKKYHWLALRPVAQANNATGDGRINSFGLGGEIAIRSGLLYQKQVIKSPVVHFGLGEQSQAEIARIVWPNGDPRAEFDLKGDKSLNVIQRLTGSCPFLFAWDGTKMGFITDCIWRSPLGLKINAQDTAGATQTLDWVKIRGDQLKPKDNLLRLSVTAELWETHFFDHLGLMSVDHPAGTEIWVDERLAFPQPPLKVYASRPPLPVRAWDDTGNEVSQIVKERDAKYLDNFGRGQYQGVTRDHWVEIEVPEAAPQSGPLYLIAHGWIHPTDSSLNVAIGQNGHNPPRGLILEVPDAAGKWGTAKPGLGFPEGKLKTVVIRLDDAFKPGAPRRARLRTNLEIYWDQISVAAGAPQAPIKTQHLTLQRADLRFRGFSDVQAADNSSPELPKSYQEVAFTGQKWRDLIGFYTRFGDVRELLHGVDDRYVIMNAGDEMQLDFQNPAPPPAGWVRDWVLIGDGWVKDGNLNTTWSKTVLPLPAHDRPDYSTPPGNLWDDPVYQRHKSDWQTYHTRYVTPRAFQNALQFARRGAD